MRLCILLMRTPSTEEDNARIFGVLSHVRGEDVAIYLLGDGVLCGRKGQAASIGGGVERALRSGAKVVIGARDLRARGIQSTELLEDLEVVEDLEGDFIEESMEWADRVITW